MSNLNETDRRNELRQCLIELSKSQDCLKDEYQRKKFFLRLEKIYCKPDGQKFRHFYSDIFATVSLIDSDELLGDISTLVDNMQLVQNEYNAYIDSCCDNTEDKIDIRKEIEKLYDHVNLDVARINYMKRITEETDSEISRNKSLLSELKEEIKSLDEARGESIAKLEEDSNRVKKEIRDGQSKMQSEYITILGIFASIVLAFTGGLAFSTSVLENIHLASPCRLAFVVETLAFVFINIIYILTWFIQKVHDGNNARYPAFMFVLNAMIAVAAITTMILWKGGNL